jgi:acetoin utilization protein AcuB
MLVKKWMTTKVITVDANDSLSEAINTLKRNRIRRMPVMLKGKLVGIVSDRDLKEASPSKATSLDIWELHYMMSHIKVKDIMSRDPITIGPDATIEKAAIFMFDNKIGGLPVVDSQGGLVGILTEQDIFNALINITGARLGGYRVSLLIKDEPGTVKEVCDLMRSKEFKCLSLLTTYHGVEEGFRELVIRFSAEKAQIPVILKVLEEKYREVVLTED